MHYCKENNKTSRRAANLLSRKTGIIGKSLSTVPFFVVLALLIGTVPDSYAGLSVTLASTDTWNMGSLYLSGSTWTANNHFGVLNDSDWFEDITVKVSSSSPGEWSPGAGAGSDVFRMSYLIGTATTTVNISPSVMKSGLAWGSTQYFGLKFDAPSASTHWDQQEIVVTVAAQAECPSDWENRTLPSGSPHYSSVIVWVPEFTPSWGGTAGGFWCDKYESSQPDATTSSMGSIGDDGAVGNTPAVSVYYKVPWGWITSINARKAALNRGSGFHLITSLEWAAIADTATVMIGGGGPGGNNNNIEPTSDQDADKAGTQYGVLDTYRHGRDGGWHCDYTGTEKDGSGGYLWSIPQNANGICDMNGNVWEHCAGIHLRESICYLMDNAYSVSSMCGDGTGSSNALTDSTKNWPTDQWNGYYLYDSAGTYFAISANNATALTISGTPSSGFYEILKNTGLNVCSGLTSGNRYLSLRTEAILKPHNVCASSDGTGSGTYGNDGYWFTTTGDRVALRSGCWNNLTLSGVFALCLAGRRPISTPALGCVPADESSLASSISACFTGRFSAKGSASI
ncbi:MAG: hypothetical protein J7M11_00905 [Elusimicrobia bacterium]|nr:hypothetical protein [Elusimicrobiota bacterium]